MDYRLSLTDRKHYSVYSKKMTYLILSISSILIILIGLIYGFQLNTSVAIFLIVAAGITRFYLNKMYFIEPFFEIKNNMISYNFTGRTNKIEIDKISKVNFDKLKVDISDNKNNLVVIKMKFIPEKHTIQIRNQLIRMAKEYNIEYDIENK